MSIHLLIAAVTAVLALVVGLTAGINKALNIQKNWIKQVIAWGCSILCSFAAYFTEFIEGVPENNWYIWVIIIGFFVGLAANGIWDITKWFGNKS